MLINLIICHNKDSRAVTLSRLYIGIVFGAFSFIFYTRRQLRIFHIPAILQVKSIVVTFLMRACIIFPITIAIINSPQDIIFSIMHLRKIVFDYTMETRADSSC